MTFDADMFGGLILNRRLYLQQTVRQFARRAGVSASTITRLEKRELPDIETFAKLCGFLEIDPNYFFLYGDKK